MAEKRTGGPYIWVTPLAKLLTGENFCEWAGWFKAHHRNWQKPPSDFDSTAWMLEHTALVNTERDGLERTGYDVYTENQNLFRLKGATAAIAGKPDLIGEKTNEILISDAKTGNRNPSHRAQVQIYQYAIPKALPNVQRQARQGPGQIPGLLRRQPGVLGKTRLRRQPRLTDPETRQRCPSTPGPQRPGMPLLRHHQGRLPGQDGRQLDSGRIHGRLLARVGKAMPRVNTTAELAGPTALTMSG